MTGGITKALNKVQDGIERGVNRIDPNKLFWPSWVKDIPFVMILAFGLYGVQALVSVLFLHSWQDEAIYMIKSWWYINGAVQPYGEHDPTWYMPIFYYVLGTWQKLVGLSFISSRVFSVLVGAFCIFGVYFVGKLVFKSNGTVTTKKAAIIAVGLLVTNPMAVRYFSSIVPQATVSFVGLVGLAILFSQNKLKWWVAALLMGGVYFGLYFLRINMIFGIILMIVYQFFTLRKSFKTRVLSVLISLVMVSLLTGWLLSLFPDPLKWWAIQFPILYPILEDSGIVANPYELLRQNTIGHSNWGIIHGWGIKAWVGSIAAFGHDFLFPYMPAIVLSGYGSIVAIKNGEWKTPAGFCAIYFFTLAVLHYLGAQSHCKTCVRAYINYFYVVGCLGGTYGMLRFFDWIKTRPSFSRGAWTGFATSFTFVALILYMVGLPWFLSLNYRKNLNLLTEMVEKHVPKGKEVMALGAQPYTPQAVTLAGRQADVPSVVQDRGFRILKDGLSKDQKKATYKQLYAISHWSDEMMKEWIVNQYEYILTGPGKHTTRHMDSIKENFNQIADYTSATGLYFQLFKKK